MKLFTVGPVEMYPETLQVSGTQPVSYTHLDVYKRQLIEILFI